jgi:flavin-dependent dehydrogenase
VSEIQTYDLLIIGGGLAGLCCALHLSMNGCKVLLIEKHKYPNHRVCGEYVSNEILPYLNTLDIHPMEVGAKRISKLEISMKNGNVLSSELPLGGFGLSRYAFDELFYKIVKNKIDIIFDTVERVDFRGSTFTVQTQEKSSFRADFVVGAFGKRSNIDTFMKRKFIKKTSPWLAVKAHYNYNFPNDTVALHNFEGGYCGLSKTETDAVNACYLTSYESFKRFGNILSFQENVLTENPHLKRFFKEAEPLFKSPLTISQISFESKKPVENHIFMIGDSAGLIHPLCGNGMAMAIHSAKIFSEIFLKEFSGGEVNRDRMETEYTRQWRETFSRRLKNGRRIQSILLRPVVASIGFSAVKRMPFLLNNLIRSTHGSVVI